MFVFQTSNLINYDASAKTANSIVSNPNLDKIPKKELERDFPLNSKYSMETAQKKLDLTIEMYNWRVGVLDKVSGITQQERLDGSKTWNEKKGINALKNMGYEEPETEFRQMQFGERGRDSQVFTEAYEVIYNVQKLYDLAGERIRKIKDNEEIAVNENEIAGLKLYMQDLIKIADITASTALKEQEKYILWAAQGWAKDRDKQKINEIFFQLVDANAKIANKSMENLYNMRGENGAYLIYTQKPQLEKYFKYINIGPNRFSKIGEKVGAYKQIVENYKYNLDKFEGIFSTELESSQYWDKHRQKVREANSLLEQMYAVFQPAVETATPIVAAISMMCPYIALLGASYFTKQAVDAMRQGDYKNAALIGLITTVPGAAAVKSGFSAIKGAGAIVAGARWLEIAGSLAGSYFMIDMGIASTRLIIDGAKYGFTPRQVQELSTQLGFMGLSGAQVKTAAEKKGVGRIKEAKISSRQEFEQVLEEISVKESRLRTGRQNDAQEKIKRELDLELEYTPQLKKYRITINNGGDKYYIGTIEIEKIDKLRSNIRKYKNIFPNSETAAGFGKIETLTGVDESFQIWKSKNNPGDISDYLQYLNDNKTHHTIEPHLTEIVGRLEKNGYTYDNEYMPVRCRATSPVFMIHAIEKTGIVSEFVLKMNDGIEEALAVDIIEIFGRRRYNINADSPGFSLIEKIPKATPEDVFNFGIPSEFSDIKQGGKKQLEYVKQRGSWAADEKFFSLGDGHTRNFMIRNSDIILDRIDFETFGYGNAISLRGIEFLHDRNYFRDSDGNALKEMKSEFILRWTELQDMLGQPDTREAILYAYSTYMSDLNKVNRLQGVAKTPAGKQFYKKTAAEMLQELDKNLWIIPQDAWEAFSGDATR